MKDEISKVETQELNKMKLQRLESANAKIIFILSKCIDQFDRDLVDHLDTTKEHWDTIFQIQQIFGFFKKTKAASNHWI